MSTTEGFELCGTGDSFLFEPTVAFPFDWVDLPGVRVGLYYSDSEDLFVGEIGYLVGDKLVFRDGCPLDVEEVFLGEVAHFLESVHIAVPGVERKQSFPEFEGQRAFG